MSQLDEIPKDYAAAVHKLAEWHTSEDLSDIEIYSFPDPGGQVVRLLEISDGFPSTGKVMAYSFGKSDEFPFRSQVAQITQDEWQSVQKGGMALPTGWDLNARVRV
jgi:hypothetical protein